MQVNEKDCHPILYSRLGLLSVIGFGAITSHGELYSNWKYY